MERELSLFAGTFTTLLAIINPLEVLPVYLKLLSGKDDATHRAVARKACTYALLLCFFFLIFGSFILRLFGVPSLASTISSVSLNVTATLTKYAVGSYDLFEWQKVISSLNYKLLHLLIHFQLLPPNSACLRC